MDRRVRLRGGLRLHENGVAHSVTVTAQYLSMPSTTWRFRSIFFMGHAPLYPYRAFICGS